MGYIYDATTCIVSQTGQFIVGAMLPSQTTSLYNLRYNPTTILHFLVSLSPPLTEVVREV